MEDGVTQLTDIAGTSAAPLLPISTGLTWGGRVVRLRPVVVSIESDKPGIWLSDRLEGIDYIH